MHVSKLNHIHTLNFLAKLLVSLQISKKTLTVPLDWASSLNNFFWQHVLMPCSQIPFQVYLFQGQLCCSHTLLTFSTAPPPDILAPAIKTSIDSCCLKLKQELFDWHRARTVARHGLLCPRNFPPKNPGVGCHFPLQGIFLTQGSNPHLLHWQVDSLPLRHLGSPPVVDVKFNSYVICVVKT